MSKQILKRPLLSFQLSRLESWKLKGGRFRICRCNFKVNKFGNLSLLGKSVLFLREPFQSVEKKGAILADIFRVVTVEVVENLYSYFLNVSAIFVLEKLGT